MKRITKKPAHAAETAREALDRNLFRAADLCRELAAKLEAKQALSQPNWGDVGDVGHMIYQLEIALGRR